jgi:hypothetical protein
LILHAARTAVSAATATRGSRTASALLELDNGVMHSERRYQEHNDGDMKQEGQQGARAPVFTSTRQRQRRELPTPHERRAR